MKNMEQTRRDFLRMAGKGMVGAAALTTFAAATPALAEGTEAPAWPWTWHPIDKEKVLAHTYDCFYSHGGCCAGVVGGVLEVMAEEFGYPYNQLNSRMFANGAGGYGTKNLCGALGGGCAVLGLFCEGPRAGALRNELYEWYKNHEFPQYQPVVESPTTVSGSILCKDSVACWMDVTGKEFGDPDRLARCAGLSAEVAAKVVELLNIEYGYEAAPVVEEPAPVLADNEYLGEADGFGGKIKVKVTMDGDKIAKIEVLEHSETAGVSDPAFATIPDAIIAAQSTSVDVVSNATYTSKGLMAAVEDALSKVKK